MHSDCRPLVFYKFILYWGETSREISGVLQFRRRYSTKTLRLCFTPEDIHMDILRPVEKPLILSIMQLWVLSKFYVAVECYNGTFSLGGKRRSLNRAITPYVASLKYYKDCNNENFPYAHYPGARQLCQFKRMLYIRQDKTNNKNRQSLV
jgi:hypothetical protein